MPVHINEKEHSTRSFASYESDPRPPVCDEAEWRFLLFLRESVQNHRPLSVELISFRNLHSSTEIHRLPAIRKSRIYGLRTYLTLVPPEHKEKLWLGGAGYSLHGDQLVNVFPTEKYLLRPISSSPPFNTLRRLNACLNVSPQDIDIIEQEVCEKGFENLFHESLEQVVYEWK